MSWFTGKVLQIKSDTKSTTVTDKGLLSSKTTTTVENAYYLVVQVEGYNEAWTLVGTAHWNQQLPLVEVGDTITFSRSRNSSQFGFAQLSILFDKRKQS